VSAHLAPFGEWDAAAYLQDYYATLEPDEAHTLRFLVREFARIERPAIALDFGAGPTLHHLLPLAPHVREIHVADCLPDNLAHIRHWVQQRRGAHDWRPFTHHVLACEGRACASEAEVQAREALTRQRITRYLHGDAARPAPLGSAGGPRYDIVMSCFCADSATDDKATWARYMAHITSLVAPGGLFVTAALRRCRGSDVGTRRFPSANIDEHDLAELLRRQGFDKAHTRIAVEPVPNRRGYGSIVLASAVRDGAPAQRNSGASGNSFGLACPALSAKCRTSNASTASMAAFKPASN
jgi:NNMT/PNMT/TEMT family